MIPINKHLDTSQLIRKGRCVDWSKNVGKYIHFIYDDIEGDIYIKDYINGKLLIKYNDEEDIIGRDNFLKCQFGNILKRKTKNFKYNIGQQIVNNNRDMILLERDNLPDNKNKDKLYKKYKYKCNICGYSCGEYYKGGVYHKELWVKETALTSGAGCACCKNEITVPGINDIPTTTEWMIQFFQGGYDEAKKYCKNSNKKIKPTCPICQEVANRYVRIQDIYLDRKFGCVCQDGFSYPEKFLYYMLKQANINFIYQLSKTTFTWCGKYRYDFYLNDYNCIIETHGQQHYIDSRNFYNQNILEIQKNDKDKRSLAIHYGIKEYIILNCKHSDPLWIQKSIEESFLSEIVDLNRINWKQCATQSMGSLKYQICEYINSNIGVTKQDVATYFNVSNSFVYNAIKYGLNYGIIDNDYYKKHINKVRVNTQQKRQKKM